MDTIFELVRLALETLGQSTDILETGSADLLDSGSALLDGQSSN